ncbi:conserved domain protein [Eggerthella sp. HGA1]|nr:conserved domain protein [Eggerthella sp. HGA1]
MLECSAWSFLCAVVATVFASTIPVRGSRRSNRHEPVADRTVDRSEGIPRPVGRRGATSSRRARALSVRMVVSEGKEAP